MLVGWEINTLILRQNGHFKCTFLNQNVWIWIEISLKFVPKGPINNVPTLVQIMAWWRQGDKPLSESVMAWLPSHICTIRLQWVNNSISLNVVSPLQWRHNEHNGVLNHQPHRLFNVRIKENIRAPRHWPLCGEFTGDGWIPCREKVSNSENASIDDVFIAEHTFGIMFHWSFCLCVTSRATIYNNSYKNLLSMPPQLEGMSVINKGVFDHKVVFLSF